MKKLEKKQMNAVKAGIAPIIPILISVAPSSEPNQ